MDISLKIREVRRRRLLQWVAASVLASLVQRPSLARDTLGQSPLKGAGSTFVAPLIQQWIKQYRQNRQGTTYATGNAGLDSDLLGSAALDYEAVGSLAGLQRLQARAVHFAFSELPLSSQVLTAQGLIQVPIVLGGVAIVTHLPGLQNPLRLDGASLAAILRGRITQWNDPTIAELNPDVALPDTAIAPVHRAEGSGTTYTLTRYLATQDNDWQQAVGVDAVVRWPRGTAVRGSSGMAAALTTTPGSIGYLDAVQAAATGMNIAMIKNAAGRFISPDTAAIEAAALAVSWQIGQDKLPELVNAPGRASYPIAATVLAVLRRQAATLGDRRARSFLAWALSNGQDSAAALGYTILPTSIARQIRAQLQ